MTRFIPGAKLTTTLAYNYSTAVVVSTKTTRFDLTTHPSPKRRRNHWTTPPPVQYRYIITASKADGRPQPLKAGGCTIHTGRTLHYSAGNSRSIKIAFWFSCFKCDPCTYICTYIHTYINTYIGSQMRLTVFYFYFFCGQSHTQTMHIKSFFTQQHCYVSLKPFTLAGFEPGSSCSWGRCDVLCAMPPGQDSHSLTHF
jgi:hypothetical protein